jgi:hypothetical protein
MICRLAPALATPAALRETSKSKVFVAALRPI